MMGLRAKASEGWGMGFLFVFFPDDEAIINKKTNPFSSSPSPSSSSSSSSSPSSSSSFKSITTLRRSSSTLLFTRAQSTISICALLIVLSLLVFTLSTFEPSTSISSHSTTSRRHLSSSIRIFNRNSNHQPELKTSLPSLSHALQGLGTLYRRGTKAMTDLIVAHITDSLTPHELRLFFRALHRSGLTSRSDLVFIYGSKPNLSVIEAIREENESFLEVMTRYEESNFTGVDTVPSFDATQFVKSSKKESEAGEPIWGRRTRTNFSEEGGTELARLSYGSVAGFDFDELDPENSLAGFLDHVPLSLRRWACYPMLLGRVRRNFKHLMLAEVKEVLVLGDPLGRVRNRSPESVYLSTVSGSTTTNKHGKKNSVKTQSHNQELVNPAIIVGGTRGVRRLSNAMLTEIVRVTTQHKRKNSVSESGVFNQLVGNGFLLKNVNLITST